MTPKTETKIEAILNNIIFQFVEDVTQTRFVNSTESGIIINSGDGNQMLWPRWCKALHVGPDVTEVKEGEFILVEPGKWTTAFRIDNVRYWKTDESRVIGVSDVPGHTY
jgi:hypothetical protein